MALTQITIEIRTTNAAFDQYPDVELTDILYRLGDAINNGAHPRSVLDSNGNKVGTVTYEEEDDE